MKSTGFWHFCFFNFRKWVHDQHLHPDEPIHVDAVHRQLNPIRVIYRYPLDALYRRFLQPTFVCSRARKAWQCRIIFRARIMAVLSGFLRQKCSSHFLFWMFSIINTNTI